METQEIGKILQQSNNVQTYFMLSEALNQRPNTTRNMHKGTIGLLSNFQPQGHQGTATSPKAGSMRYTIKASSRRFSRRKGCIKYPVTKSTPKSSKKTIFTDCTSKDTISLNNRNSYEVAFDLFRDGNSVFEQMMKQ